MPLFSASFVGASAVRPVGLKRSESALSYRVDDQASWRENAASHGLVTHEGRYGGTDLLVHALGSRLRHESHVAPGGNYAQLAVSYEGIEDLSVAEDASLLMGFGGDGVL